MQGFDKENTGKSHIYLSLMKEHSSAEYIFEMEKKQVPKCYICPTAWALQPLQGQKCELGLMKNSKKVYKVILFKLNVSEMKHVRLCG